VESNDAINYTPPRLHRCLSGYDTVLGIDNATLASMDKPPSLSMNEQQERFRYVINAEGQ